MEDGYKRGVEFCATNSLNGVNCVYSTAGIIQKEEQIEKGKKAAVYVHGKYVYSTLAFKKGK